MNAPAALSQRGDIRLGYRCNARCGFCYYYDSLDNPVQHEPTTTELRNRIRQLRAAGATELEFTGGEPTIRPDLAELIRYAASLGFVNISMITNGLRLGKRAYADAVIDAGVNDFLFSIHGHDASLHDRHTSIPGSFDRIMAAVQNVRAHGVRCRSSTTVTGRNYRHMTDIVGFLTSLPVDCMNLAVFSPVTQARGADDGMYVRYSDAAAAIKSAIDRHRDRLPPLSVKYIPFCFMQGYERYVMNLYQQSFDPDDWNYYLSNKIRRTKTRLARFAFDAAALAGALLAKDRSAARGLAGLKVLGFTRIVELLRKKRVPACRSCRYDVVCDHAWTGYVARYGDAEFAPVRGEKVLDPAWCYGVARHRRTGDRLTRERPAVAVSRAADHTDIASRNGQ
jgi:MoaA/NifB/PqqE/SkfB family radical SAM enzyme